MKIFNSNSVFDHHCRLWRALALVTFLTGCLGGGYQAPITDRSQTHEQRSVVIVTESDDRPSRYIGARSNPNSTNSADRRGSTASIQAVNEVPLRPGVHRVAGGDTLYSIAFQYNLDFRSLALGNNLSPPYTIVMGQELFLDLNRTTLTSGAASIASGVGTQVSNNSVASTRAATSSVRGVIRQPIVRAPVRIEPNWQWPVQGQILNSFQNNSAPGSGLDIATTTGQAVYAAASGDVVYAGNGIQGSGNLIIVRHNDRFLSAYAHNSTMLVREGDRVTVGDLIGEAGESPSGRAMLHFEIRLDGNPVDPLGYLPRL